MAGASRGVPAVRGGRQACLVLLQDGYDLLFRKPTTLHVLVLKLGQNELQTGLNCGGKVKRHEGYDVGFGFVHEGRQLWQAGA